MYVSLRGLFVDTCMWVRMRKLCVCPTWHSACDPQGPLCVCVCKYVCVLASLQLSPHIHPFSDDWTSQWISPSCYLHGSTQADTHFKQCFLGLEPNPAEKKLAHQCVQSNHLIWNRTALDWQPVLRWSRCHSTDVDRRKHAVDSNRQPSLLLVQ